MKLRQLFIRVPASCFVLVFLSLFLSTPPACAQQVAIKGPKDATSQYSGATYGPIVPSDTLWRIANRYNQDGNHSVYQVMQAIYELNPQAFENNNINLIKDGSVLKLPSRAYISRISAQQAKQRAEQDNASFRPSAQTATNVAVLSQKSAVSKEDLSETKQALEDKLSAIDQEQERQFLAIRQQFAESIQSVQGLLNENQKLYERLDAVNADISEIRNQEVQNQQQLDKQQQVLEELLSISKQAQQQKQAEMQRSSLAWLTEPITLLVLSVLFTLCVLGGLTWWLLKRKKNTTEQEVESAIEPVQQPPHTAEMDDLSDSLAEELSGDLNDDADDLFEESDDDLLDDVLAEELQESLDETLDNELENFDDLSDDMLVPDSAEVDMDKPLDDSTEVELFEEGSSELSQNDLDSLFDDVDDDPVVEADSSLDPDIDAIDLSDTDTEEETQSEIPDPLEPEPIAPEPVAEEVDETLEAQFESSVGDESLADDDADADKPDISIDELLEEPTPPTLPDSIDANQPGVVSEQMLDQLDKEVGEQNAELDKATEELLNELEQVEMMQGMLGDDLEEEEPAASGDVAQHSIQTLDDVTEGMEDILQEAPASQAKEQDLSITDLDSLVDTPDSESSVNETLADELLAELDPQQSDQAAEPASVTSNENEDLADELLAQLSEELVEPEQQEPEVEADDQSSLATQDDLADELLVELEAELSEQEVPEQQQLEQETSEQTIAEQEEQEPHDDELLDEAFTPELSVGDEPEIAADTDQIPVPQEEPSMDEGDPVLSEVDGNLSPEGVTADELLTQIEDSGQEEIAVDVESTTATDDIDELDLALTDFDAQQESVSPQDPESPAIQNQQHEQAQQGSDKGLELDDDLRASPAADVLDDLAMSLDTQSEETVASEILDQALTELEQQGDDQLANADQSDLSDLPDLDDWLSPESRNEEKDDNALLSELENTDFDELLESLDDPKATTESQKQWDDSLGEDGVLDLDVLLNESEPPVSSEAEEPFLDVDALLTESVQAESEPLEEKALELDVSLEDFTGVSDDGDVIDVDADETGMGAKLDLARAYMEMDDQDAAKSLLQEIIDKGNPDQQQEANTLLASLS